MALLIGVAHVTAFGQLPAMKGKAGSGERPSEPPKGKKTVSEPEKYQSKQGKTSVVVEADYMIGIQGYGSDDGVVVMNTVSVADWNQNGKKRCAAEQIEVDFKGNGKTVKVKLEAGDLITAVDGSKTTTLDELVVAINSASNPHSMDITFIDWRTGNEYTGTINAMKKKK